MKIKITEDQAKRLKLVEGLDPVSQFEQLCRNKSIEIDRLFNKVSGISIAEIIGKEVNLEDINKVLDRIESEISAGNRKAFAFVGGIEDNGLDARIDKADDSVVSKLTSLQLLTMDLEKVQLSIEQHGIGQAFANIKNIEI